MSEPRFVTVRQQILENGEVVAQCFNDGNLILESAPFNDWQDALRQASRYAKVLGYTIGVSHVSVYR